MKYKVKKRVGNGSGSGSRHYHVKSRPSATNSATSGAGRDNKASTHTTNAANEVGRDRHYHDTTTTPPPILFPWTAQRNVDGTVIDIPRPELEDGKAGRVFKGSAIAPVHRYTILDPNNPERSLELDDSQLGAVNLVLSGATCCIVGAAGTGKSTILQAVLEIITPEKKQEVSYRIVRSSGARAHGPGVALISFTNKAVRVIQSKVLASPILKEYGHGANITTGHNLLEYTRVQGWSEEKQKEVMRFEEQRGEWNPLDVEVLCIDEASMVGVGKEGAGQLGNKLHNALLEGTQEVLMGDINQLPPVGGKSILSYGLNSLPIAELTTIHRQAMDSPIISQAWNVLQGKGIEDSVNPKTGSVVRKIAPKKRGAEGVVKMGAATMNAWLEKNLRVFIEKELFVPGRDIVLSPVNKQHDSQGRPYVSTWHMNAVIGSYLAEREGREVYEIIAGYNKVYLAVEDRVMVDKIEGSVVGIRRNLRYVGKMPRESSTELTHFGWNRKTRNHAKLGNEEDPDFKSGEYDYSALDLDAVIDLSTHNDSEDQEEGRQASHVVEVLLDTGETRVLNNSGEFGPQQFTLGYAISVHKSQGSEWENVLIVLHDGLPGMLSRELLYTGMTRPKSKLFVIAQDHVVDKCVKKARIKGKGLKGKLEFFNDGDYLNAGEAFGFDKLSKMERC